MGYSDITALLVAIHHMTGLVTFMGPAILPQFGKFGGMLDYTKRSFRSVLMDPLPVGQIQPSEQWTDESLLWDSEDNRVRQMKGSPGTKVLRTGISEGPILSNNAGTLLLLSGTPYFPNLEGRILCLEDDEGEIPGSSDLEEQKLDNFTYGEVLRHVIAHEIQHIGQLSVWARELGREPVSANLIGRKLW